MVYAPLAHGLRLEAISAIKSKVGQNTIFMIIFQGRKLTWYIIFLTSKCQRKYDKCIVFSESQFCK